MDNQTSATVVETTDSSVSYTRDIVIQMVIACLGILDNGLVVIIMLRNRVMRTRLCNLFIIHQSIVDLVASLFLMCNSPSVPTLGSPDGISAEFYCRVWDSNYLFWAAVTASTYNLVAITIERYLEVVHPLRYKAFFTWKRAKIIVIAVWLIGLAIPIVTSVIPSPATTDGKCQKHSSWSSAHFSWLAGFYALFFGFLLPVIVMIVCYSQMIHTFNSKVKTIDANTIITEGDKRRSERVLRVRKSLIKTMLMVSIVFVICWIGDQIYFFLFNIRVIKLQHKITTFVVSLAFLNSCINPIIYTWQYNDFQKAAAAFFKRESDNERSAQEMSSQIV